MLSDLWFLKATPQEAINSPGTRGCIYPFSYYHLHGIFQFFAYGIIFPIGYLIGRLGRGRILARYVHISLQVSSLFLSRTYHKNRSASLDLVIWSCISYMWLFIWCSLSSCSSMGTFTTCTWCNRDHHYDSNFISICARHVGISHCRVSPSVKIVK